MNTVNGMNAVGGQRSAGQRSGRASGPAGYAPEDVQ